MHSQRNWVEFVVYYVAPVAWVVILALVLGLIYYVSEVM